MFKRSLLNTLILVGFSSIPAIVMADAPAAPTLGSILDASGISVTGYMDMGYSNLNTTGLFVNQTTGTNGLTNNGATNTRIFDAPQAAQGTNYSNLNLHQAAITVSKLPKEGMGGLINLTAGQDAPGLSSVGMGGGQADHFIDVTQAFMNYADGALTVQAGKYATLAGAEVISAVGDKNYSRSWMFGWGPYTHTGLRATYAASDKVTVITGVNNGWDQTVPVSASGATGSTGPTGELSVVLAPNSVVTWATTLLDGVAQGSSAASGFASSGTMLGNRTYVDSVLTINATDKLNLVADYAHGQQQNVILPTGTVGNATWDAIAAYANYQFTEVWRGSYRFERFNDPDGYRSQLYLTASAPTGQVLTGNTLTVGYAVTKALELRGEVRFDQSSVNAFQSADGSGTSTQHSFGLEAVAQF